MKTITTFSFCARNIKMNGWQRQKPAMMPLGFACGLPKSLRKEYRMNHLSVVAAIRGFRDTIRHARSSF
jgi:hypothetical protein